MKLFRSGTQSILETMPSGHKSLRFWYKPHFHYASMNLGMSNIVFASHMQAAATAYFAPPNTPIAQTIAQWMRQSPSLTKPGIIIQNRHCTENHLSLSCTVDDVI